MNLKQLRLFHEVMTTGKISLAADRMSFSQPAASKMLASLEDLVGYQLFLRQNGRLQPTPEAVFLHAETLNVLEGMKRLEDSFERARHGQLGKINIGSTPGPSYSLLPGIINACTQQHPDLKMSLQMLASSIICENVASGQLELGLADRVPVSNRYDLTYFELPVYCAIHHSHPQADQPLLSPTVLNNERWITFSPEDRAYQALETAYQREALTFRPLIEVNNTLNALAFVQSGYGVTLVDAINRQHFSQIHPDSGVLFRRFSLSITEPLYLLSQNCRPLSRQAMELKSRITTALNTLCTVENTTGTGDSDNSENA